jgi:FMN phosphatase YigB (HAD superfamily)
MQEKIKAIIFDWGRTLHDPQVDALFPGVLQLIKRLSETYILVLVSLAVTQTTEERRKTIAESGVADYFKVILVNTEHKDEMYDEVIKDLGLSSDEVALVDDQVIRGVAWGNRHDALTVWLKKGKFSEKLPNEETGEPNYIISDIRDLEKIF